MASLFASAKAIAPKAPAKKDTKDQVQISGLEQLAEIDALMKSLDTLKKSIAEEVKAEALDHFFNEAMKNEKRPENFKGVDGIASASIELRKRSTASALNEVELSLFEEYKIPTEKVVSVQRLFGINPAYANNDKLLEKVSKAIENIVPDDFIVVQEEQFKTVVSEDTIDQVFTRIRKLPSSIFNAISVVAIKPKLETTDVGLIMDNLRNLVAPKAKK